MQDIVQYQQFLGHHWKWQDSNIQTPPQIQLQEYLMRCWESLRRLWANGDYRDMLNTGFLVLITILWMDFQVQNSGTHRLCNIGKSCIRAASGLNKRHTLALAIYSVSSTTRSAARIFTCLGGIEIKTKVSSVQIHFNTTSLPTRWVSFGFQGSSLKIYSGHSAIYPAHLNLYESIIQMLLSDGYTS